MSSRRALLLALAVVLAWPAAAQAVSPAGLRSTLNTLHHRLGSAAGAYVVDLSDGAVLYSSRPTLALAPASNEKLFVTATALLRFGASGTLTTRVQPTPGATVANGVLDGDLYLVGGGDPTLDDAGLGTLADTLAGAGVTKIDGGVIGDESFFDALRGGPDSRYRYDSDLGGFLGGLAFDHGRASSATRAATKLAALLKARKVTYKRKPRAGRLPAGGGDDQALATLASPTVGALIQRTNVPSENYYAEMLTKALGATYGASGSTTAGLSVIRAQMATLGVHPKMIDGSGLSHSNRTTAQQLVRLLQRMDGQDSAATWRASLPIAGRTGTLRSRMRGTAAAGRCAAKTGTLIGVSALSGYCTTTGGRAVAFSFVENKVCNYCAKAVEDRMVSAIARLDG
ncbi:MAG TPA: D-alanyl-D-alanine carboxypeptidase/D-alanyl-D-alanine-endopeptidase [Baekduia sp.]|uniref:D-alanyl-D-alanine carboxypeptidase/D-alanyl-D-alanine endopeptidase n=1 Tax=Baekduia sp. TaxID=2600305 RepID=UPI002D76691C|nr:D-alanyl-D-alanine carboxypeptidase/D-alanyl-D-alanine-endopeptidase [Baekduia sp.]HET6510051.1 D-alanyl-D-alanine carboxypeptidase/D-alanyl-D-alanine-endopeptidase [Baekduia sp.]